MSLSHTIYPLRAFKDNYIWVIQEVSQKGIWVVDPGAAHPVLDRLKAHDLQLRGILLTHHHQDHSGGIQDLLQVFGSLPVYGSFKSACPLVNHFIQEGDDIFLDTFKLTALEIPGHTLDHVAFYNDTVLFAGDTLFSAGCGKVFEGTPLMMYESLNKLKSLNENIHLYCGHEYTKANLLFAKHVEPFNTEIQKKLNWIAIQTCTLPSQLREEKKWNPFLRCEEETVRQAVENYAHQTLSSPVDIFKYLRAWKNEFIV